MSEEIPETLYLLECPKCGHRQTTSSGSRIKKGLIYCPCEEQITIDNIIGKYKLIEED